MTPDTFATFSLSGSVCVVAVLSGVCGGLIGLGAGGALGWLSGYAAGAFRMWRG